MALASLCVDYKANLGLARRHRAQFSAFIVDHGMRDGSKDEASMVADELDRIGIPPSILTLDWSSHGDPKSTDNIENVARQLRYQAIGKACSESHIQKVLVAHHADDQAETVLIRIMNKYFGQGLGGIGTFRNIPECYGIYGVDQSGRPYYVNTTDASVRSRNGELITAPAGLESGGVQICRPLLAFSKEELINVCRNANVKWIEDHTNADLSLAMRNTVRHLEQRGDLPKALQPKSLCELADRLREQRSVYEKRADELFNELPITLNLAAGIATFGLPMGFTTGMDDEKADYTVKACLLRRLLQLASPTPAIGLSRLHAAIGFVFEGDITNAGRCQIMSCLISEMPSTESGMLKFYIFRQPLSKRRLTTENFTWPSKQKPQNGTHWSNWLLWDSRYWIRVGSDRPRLPVGVTFLTKDSLGTLRKSIESPRQQSMLEQRLSFVPTPARLSIPALVPTRIENPETPDGDDAQQKETEILALPSLRWYSPKFVGPRKKETSHLGPWKFQFRYKKVDLGDMRHHRVVFGEEVRKEQLAHIRRDSRRPASEREAEGKLVVRRVVDRTPRNVDREVMRLAPK